VAGRLRGAALVMLADLDHRLAGFHAARLITNPDPLTSPMSGEPALTAVRVLAAQDQLTVLYGWLTSAGPKAPEPAAEALRAMTGAPASIVQDLVERMAPSGDEVLLLGLFDLVACTASSAASRCRSIATASWYPGSISGPMSVWKAAWSPDLARSMSDWSGAGLAHGSGSMACELTIARTREAGHCGTRPRSDRRQPGPTIAVPCA
jgi:hypothetical protein